MAGAVEPIGQAYAIAGQENLFLEMGQPDAQVESYGMDPGAGPGRQ